MFEIIKFSTWILVTQYIGGGELLHLVEQYGCLTEDIVKIYVGEIALALGTINIF